MFAVNYHDLNIYNHALMSGFQLLVELDTTTLQWSLGLLTHRLSLIGQFDQIVVLLLDWQNMNVSTEETEKVLFQYQVQDIIVETVTTTKVTKTIVTKDH